MTIEIITLCDFAQSNGDKLNVIGAFNTINIERLPSTHSFSIAVKLRYNEPEYGTKRISFKLVDPNNKDIITNLMAEVEIPKPIDKFISISLIVNLESITFTDTGVYRLLIETGNDKFESPLHIRIKN